MYQIISSMNNNVTLAQDVNGEEVVLIGSGIGFNKNKGIPSMKKRLKRFFIFEQRNQKRTLFLY